MHISNANKVPGETNRCTLKKSNTSQKKKKRRKKKQLETLYKNTQKN
jgi:hypothetical protein